MNADYDIIIFSLTRWDHPMSGSSLAFAKEFSRHHRVFFVDRPFSIKDLFNDYETFDLKKRINAILFRHKPFISVNTGYSNFTVAIPGLCLPLNFLPKGFVFNFFNRFNQWVVKACIRKMIAKFGIKNYIYINYFNPALLPVLTNIRPKPLANIYYITNNIRLSKYVSKHGVAGEEKALEFADFVLVSSRFQFKRLISQKSNIHYIPNGVDYEFYEAARVHSVQKPYDLLNIGDTKIIMFCGYLSAIRIDYQLLKLICETYPHYLVVMVGTYEERDLLNYRLEHISNLIILGNRRYESMPGYLNTANVTIIPYLCNELNKSVYPLKLNEYLAMGKPVVTTHFSEDLDGFSEIIYIADTYDEFIDSIQIAMDNDNENLKNTRFETAAKNTWKRRVEHMENIFTKRITSN
ncbi:MAG: glycosyltransferase [Bacteroidota bacterium]|nr:glycosyltransferase [Bacteroidota bacterium]